MTSAGQSHALISVDDLATHLADPEWVVVDCRFKLMKPGAGREAYHAGHIPGAFYADLDQDLASGVSAASGGRHPLPEVGALSHLFARWGVGADSMVVVYDDLGGAVSARLWWLFRWMGHSRVALLDGDLRAWKAAEQPLSTDVPEYVKVSAAPAAVGRPGNMPVVTVTQLEAGLEPLLRRFS